MGKASKWFRGLLGLKKSDHSSPSQPPATSRSHPSPNPPKKKWGFGKSSRDKDHQNSTLEAGERAPGDDPEKHAIAVAAASAAVAEAAVAAAQAAAAVVRLTNSGRSMTSGIAGGNNHTVAYGSGNRGLVIREQWAAVKIQSHFRAHLARKALRALKSLVRLQALVRGHILRKQTGERLRQLQAISRAQARARALRAHNSDLQYSNFKSTQFHSHGPATPEKFEHILRAKSMKHDQSSMLKKSGSRSSDQDRVRSVWSGSGHRTDDDEKSDKILEIDSGNNKPYFLQKRRNLFQSCHLSLSSDLSSSEVNSYPTPLKSARDIEDETEEETLYGTANNSPRFGSFTPAKSDGSRNGYPDFPNYMSYTESARAKMRSMSAPRQRPAPVQSEGSSVSGSIKRYSVHANFTSKAYPGSGRLDRLGMPVVGGGDAVGFSGGGNWMRY